MTRDEAIELLEDLDGAIEDNHGRDYDEAFRMAIESLSADKVEVVRCGECKFLTPSGLCPVFADDDIRPSVSDFCSYGERREP